MDNNNRGGDLVSKVTVWKKSPPLPLPHPQPGKIAIQKKYPHLSLPYPQPAKPNYPHDNWHYVILPAPKIVEDNNGTQEWKFWLYCHKRMNEVHWLPPIFIGVDDEESPRCGDEAAVDLTDNSTTKHKVSN